MVIILKWLGIGRLMRCDEMRWGVLSLGMEWKEDYPAGLYLAKKKDG